MLFFGFQSPLEFYRDELHYFFDCLFRGLLNLVITKGEQMPKYRGCYVSHAEITKLVKKVFPLRWSELSRRVECRARVSRSPDTPLGRQGEDRFIIVREESANMA